MNKEAQELIDRSDKVCMSYKYSKPLGWFPILQGETMLSKALVDMGFASSGGEAKRLIQQGGVEVNLVKTVDNILLDKSNCEIFYAEDKVMLYMVSVGAARIGYVTIDV